MESAQLKQGVNLQHRRHLSTYQKYLLKRGLFLGAHKVPLFTTALFFLCACSSLPS